MRGIVFAVILGFAAGCSGGAGAGEDIEDGGGTADTTDTAIIDTSPVDVLPVSDADEAPDSQAPDAGADAADFDLPESGAEAQCAAGDWVTIPGGTFQMGSADVDCGGWAGGSGPFRCANPVHAVSVPPFAIGRTEVTVCQYRACVASGGCAEAPCIQENGELPVGCVGWEKARAFCVWARGRLCTEAEWEFAARNGSNDDAFPWGNGEPTCEFAVFDSGGSDSCACDYDKCPPCSRVKGNSLRAVCDLAGNAWEWVQDYFHDNYVGAPTDGSAWEVPAREYRVLRGGCEACQADHLQSSFRGYAHPDAGGYYEGIRCCRSE